MSGTASKAVKRFRSPEYDTIIRLECTFIAARWVLVLGTFAEIIFSNPAVDTA
jgi:hypothetical protein